MLDKLLAAIPESVWVKVDKITTTCPTCAFCRGLVLGAALGALAAWLL